MKKILFTICLLGLIGVGCGAPASNMTKPPVSKPITPINPRTKITYFLSPNEGDKLKYCNGGDMDSAGYKKNLTKEDYINIVGDLSLNRKIFLTLYHAAAGEGFFPSSDPRDNDEGYTRVSSTTYENGVVTLHPGGGWAGVSIFDCAWRPFVEKQLEQFSEVKQIKWEEATNY